MRVCLFPVKLGEISGKSIVRSQEEKNKMAIISPLSGILDAFKVAHYHPFPGCVNKSH